MDVLAHSECSWAGPIGRELSVSVEWWDGKKAFVTLKTFVAITERKWRCGNRAGCKDEYREGKVWAETAVLGNGLRGSWEEQCFRNKNKNKLYEDLIFGNSVFAVWCNLEITGQYVAGLCELNTGLSFSAILMVQALWTAVYLGTWILQWAQVPSSATWALLVLFGSCWSQILKVRCMYRLPLELSLLAEQQWYRQKGGWWPCC